MADWAAFKIQVPGKDALEKVRGVLEKLLIFLDIAKAILETIKAFLIDFGNPIRILVEQLIKLILDLIEALKRTGLYAYYDVPTSLQDPSFKRHLGGYVAFTQRFKGSLLDSKDMNRPQPIRGALKGGFIIILADAEGPLALLRLIKILLSFFGQEFLQPRYLPPANLKVIPVGAKGDPILAVTKIFQNQVEAIALEWSLASSTPSGDASLTGFVSHLGQEFIPPKWLVERAEIPLTQEIVIDPDKDPSALRDTAQAGRVMMNVTTTFSDPRHLNKTVTRKTQVVDEYGDPVIKFNTAAVLGYGSATFLLGQLGTFRFIDTNVEYDKVYFYRVRAFTGPLDIDEKNGVIEFQPLEKNANEGNRLYLKWPSSEPKSEVVMGKPSGIVRVKLAKLPEKFDVMAVLRATFLTAFSLNFHQPLPQGDPVLDGSGNPVLDKDKNPTYKPIFDSKGAPLPPYDVTIIGQGELVTEAGAVVGLKYLPLVNTGSLVTALAPNPVTGEAPLQPWQEYNMRIQAARMSNRYGSLLLNNGTGMIENFRKLMQGPLPKGPIKTSWPGIGTPKTLEQLVLAFTKVNTEPVSGVTGLALKAAQAISEINPTGTVDADTAKAFGDAYKEEAVRRNIIVAVEYLKAMGYTGTPPDWLQVSLLRDIIPWSGQFIYDLLAKIQALLDAFQGVIDEIKKFIELLERKINALEDFIKYLISILDFIAKLDVGFYTLYVPEVPGGDVSDWMTAVDSAGGNVPPSGPGGYSAGIAFAYLAADISAFRKAFGMIF